LIIGTGTDLIDIRRIEKTLDRFGDRFTQRCFTETEQAKSDRRKERAASYAKRYAAKEACAKALGTGISRGVSWKEIGVVNLPGGKPTLELKGRALDWLARLMPEGLKAVVHISITDEPPFALATVIIEALPGDEA